MSAIVGMMEVAHMNLFMSTCPMSSLLHCGAGNLAFVLVSVGPSDVFLLLFIMFDNCSTLTFLSTCIMVITACINLYRNVHNNRYLLAFCLVYHLECCAMPDHIIRAMCQPNILKEYDLLVWFCD